jgi:hypothetical protein
MFLQCKIKKDKSSNIQMEDNFKIEWENFYIFSCGVIETGILNGALNKIMDSSIKKTQLIKKEHARHVSLLWQF